MGKDTEIEWCDSTVNPMMGCDGCELWTAKNKTCYAGVLTLRHQKKRDGKIKAAAKRGEKYDPWNGKDGWPHNFETPIEIPRPKMKEAAAWCNLRAKKERVSRGWMDFLDASS